MDVTIYILTYTNEPNGFLAMAFEQFNDQSERTHGRDGYVTTYQADVSQSRIVVAPPDATLVTQPEGVRLRWLLNGVECLSSAKDVYCYASLGMHGFYLR